jgi:uncharacterized protein (DUF2461 family)
MFKGFTQDTIDFLYRLRENNNKQWMDEHRDEYKEYVFKPFRQLAAEMGPMMLTIDPGLDIRPHRMVSRINRDIRFSKKQKPLSGKYVDILQKVSEDWKENPVPTFLSYFLNITATAWGFTVCPGK